MVYPRQQRTLETGGGCVTLEFNCDYTARPFQVTKEAKLHEVDLSCAILPLSQIQHLHFSYSLSLFILSNTVQAERRQCFLFWGEIQVFVYWQHLKRRLECYHLRIKMVLWPCFQGVSYSLVCFPFLKLMHSFNVFPYWFFSHHPVFFISYYFFC